MTKYCTSCTSSENYEVPADFRVIKSPKEYKADQGWKLLCGDHADVYLNDYDPEDTGTFVLVPIQ